MRLGQTPTDDEIEEMVRKADSDGNGEIDFPEFLTLMSKKMLAQDPDREIKEAWDILSNGKTYMDPYMLGKVMINLGETVDDEKIQELLNEVDFDGDGKVNYDDFHKMMKKEN